MRFALTLATLLTLASCSSEPPQYQSQRCKDLRSRVRMIQALKAQLQTTAFAVEQAQIDATVQSWRDEQPECFDPKL